MSPNLIEFLKVFSIVATFSTLLLLGHNYMWKLIEEDGKKEDDNVLDFPKIISSERKASNEADLIDYDGMGNQGRFPNLERK
tara:strand:- start:1937 stop:2182 length:246 start_codon:yes stop_codon:yes gene_type:complete